MMKNRARLISLSLLLLPIVALASGCNKKAQVKQTGPPAAAVDVTPVTTSTIERTVPVTGSIQTLYNVSLAAQTTGQVNFIQVREGDTVRKGQLLVQLDPTVAEQTVQQDNAAVINDQAKVQQAQTQYEQSITNANVAILQAQQQLTAALANLQKTKFPNQPQQLAQVKDQLIQQQANFQNAKSFYQRQQQLYNEGAIAASDYDNAYTQYKTQEALLNNYQQAYNLALQGGRAEDINAAKQVVSEDEQAVRNAKANAAQVRVNKEAITAAKATVKQAQATLAAARQQLQYTKIYSPIDGVVSQRNTDQGQIATPGTTLLQLVDLSTVYYEPTVSEDQFSQLSMGQRVSVDVDAYPGRTFHGTITSVYPAAVGSNRQFSVRVTIPNPGKLLRPGMYARGDIVTAVHHNAVVVPISALVAALPQGYAPNQSSNAISYGNTVLPPESVFVVGPGNKAVQRSVTVGIETTDQAEITSGLSPGDQLITTGQGLLTAGAPVKVANRKELAQRLPR